MQGSEKHLESLTRDDIVEKLEAEYKAASKTGNIIDDKLQEMTSGYADKGFLSTLNETRKQQLKKKKPDYRLYPIYQHIVGMLGNCQSTLDELFVFGDPDSLQADVLFYTETANYFSDISDGNKRLVTEMYNLYEQVRKRPEEIRVGWIKDKVPQNRFTKKGQEYALALEEVGNSIFSLSALVVDFQIQLQSVLKNSGELDVE